MTNFTGNNQTFTILAGTTDTVTGTGDTIIIGAGANVSVYGSGNASSFTDVGSVLFDYGTNDTATVGVNNTTVDFYGNGDTVNLNGTGDLVNLLGVSDAATINGNGSWAYFVGATNSTVNLNGQSEWATVAQGSGNRININGAGSYAGLNTNNNTADLYGNNDGAYSYGTGDLINLLGVSDAATINGNGSWAYFVGATNSTVNLNGQSEWATVAQGSGNRININGAGSYASLNTNNNTADLYGNNDGAYSYGTGDLINLLGVSDGATINGNGSVAYFVGASNSTVNLNGQSDWATVAQVQGNTSDHIIINGQSSSADVEYSNNTVDEYGTNDTLQCGGSGSGCTFNLHGNSEIVNCTGSYNAIYLSGNSDAANCTGGSTNDTIHLSGAQSGFDTVYAAEATIDIDSQNVLASISNANTIINNTGHVFINAAFGSLDVNDNFVAGAVSSQFQQAVGLAIQFYETHAANNVVLNEDFASTEANPADQTGDAFNLPSSYTASYASVVAALGNGANATTALPKVNPFGGTSILMTTAQAKLYGLMPSNYGNVDDVVALAQNTVFNYSQSGITSKQVDAVGALEHEISEGMGRVAEAGVATVAGLHIYTSANQIDTAGTSATDTFRINNGTTTIGPSINENAVRPGSDIADWNDNPPVTTTQFDEPSLSGYDSYGWGFEGVYGVVSSADATVMDALGWNFV